MRKLLGPCLVALALLLPLLGSLTVGPAGTSFAVGDLTVPPFDDSVSGGALFICVASGILFGASCLMGNVLGAAGAVTSAIHNGCIF